MSTQYQIVGIGGQPTGLTCVGALMLNGTIFTCVPIFESSPGVYGYQGTIATPPTTLTLPGFTDAVKSCPAANTNSVSSMTSVFSGSNSTWIAYPGPPQGGNLFDGTNFFWPTSAVSRSVTVTTTPQRIINIVETTTP